MQTRALIDSNVFIFGFERRRSNSRRILEKLAAGDLRGVVTDRIALEVMKYFRKYYGKALASEFREFILLTCDLVLEEDLHTTREHVRLVGAKDAGALAATRELGLARLVTTDRDFAEVLERRTPRQFLVDFHERTQPGDE